MIDVSSAVDSMNKLSLENNISLQTFINTANSTFKPESEISVWVGDLGVITHDIRYLKKLVVSVVDAGNCATLGEQTKMFKDILSIDFEVDMRITNTALKIDMIELWTNTKKDDVWVDKTPDYLEKGDTVYIPYDYYLFEKPVLFTDVETAGKYERSNIIGLVNPESVTSILPYIKYTV